ncbi:hypothetical protein CIK05_14430 [Bdellovibrio sp. qaytius]|nr:hypothetical protein CIK05_14430 [Bdellovibrio sp. qaytius]
MKLGKAKRKSFLIFLMMLCFFLAGAFATESLGKEIGIALMLIPTLVGFLVLARLKCENCGLVLSKKIPVGPLILLWLADDKCPKCNADF